jgi:polar amino acid transport system permease protein
MHYVFQFGVVWDHIDELMAGALATLWMSCLAMVFGLAIGVACAYLRKAGPGPLRWTVATYVEFFRNTPLLVQLFIIYFSLPAIGLRLDAEVAAVLGLSINLGAYATEIVRSGIEAIPQGQIEAGRALGLSRLQIFRFVILYPALKTAYPALASQFVILMLGSSIVSAISATELTAVTNSLQSTTFRAFEFYFVATAIYLAMATGVRTILDGIYWVAFRRGRPA